MESRTFMCPIGNLTVTADEGCIVAIQLSSADVCPADNASTPLLEWAEAQLRAFLDGRLRSFDFPIRLIGTPFQLSVWHTLQEIPYGSTRTYGEVAAHIGHPKAARATGMACNRNPLLLVVPCHRVVGAGGSLTGFACGLDIKRHLLEMEQRIGK
jgi:methylated-DNA-[protein]-cysteine S-methyltransferase